jgi:ABC-type glycerol-3-phosphate transport system permease component
MTRSWRGQQRRRARARTLFLAAITLVLLVPLLWTLLASFGVTPDNGTSPPQWSLPPSLAHYAEVGVAEPTYLQDLVTSLLISALATLLTSAVAFLAAYGLARSRFAGRRLLVQSFLVLASLPVMAYVIPLNDTMQRLHLADTFAGVALAGTAVYTPLAVYILHGYLAQIAPDAEEAAHLDGATSVQMLWSIVLPIVAPGVIATACIVFVLNWNLFLIPLVLTLSRVKTIPVAMSDFFTFERELEWPTAAAALIVSLLPLVAFVALAHRALEQFSLGTTPHEPDRDVVRNRRGV